MYHKMGQEGMNEEASAGQEDIQDPQLIVMEITGKVLNTAFYI